MKPIASVFIAAVSLIATMGCSTGGGGAAWTTLVDGTVGLDNFNRVGEANWSATDGAIQASQGGKDPAYLVSKNSYKDFLLRAEFWASDDANSGVFLRCQDPRLRPSPGRLRPSSPVWRSERPRLGHWPTVQAGGPRFSPPLLWLS